MSRRRPLLPALALLGWLVLPVPAAAGAEPSIRLIPRPATTGQPVNLIGVDFCGGAGCSPVTVRVDQRVAATDVAVQGDGTFNIALHVSEPEGEYTVSASQSGPAGPIGATTTMIVATIDYPGGATTGAPAPPPSTTASNDPEGGAAGTAPVTGRQHPPGTEMSGGEGPGGTGAGSRRAPWPAGVALALGVVLVGALAVGAARRSRRARSG